jgi:hypothetical protein
MFFIMLGTQISVGLFHGGVPNCSNEYRIIQIDYMLEYLHNFSFKTPILTYKIDLKAIL